MDPTLDEKWDSGYGPEELEPTIPLEAPELSVEVLIVRLPVPVE